jgi:protein involved in polysaccharide export with SLBB domain
VQPDGTITVPLIGDFSVIGQTTAEVTKTLSTRWKKYVVNPS